MYDRAIRVLTQPATGTSVNVGPGSYNADIGGFNAKRKVDGYAPFCSMSSRASFLTVKKSDLVNPGPGSFQPTTYDHLIGASSLANKAQRFPESYDETPGPGSYNLSKASDWVKSQPANKQYDEKSSSQTFHASRVLAPPSIPSPGQSYGYEDAGDGNLRKQPSPEKDKTLGPAFYRVRDEETAAVKKYKGIHFGKMKSKRTLKFEENFKGEDIPAPGCYDPYVPTWNKMGEFELEGEKKMEAKPIISKLPRYHEIVTILENKKAVPGPGHYEIKSQFEKNAQTNEPSQRPSFGSQAKRFSESNEQTPAPASYNDPRHALEICNRISGLKNSPFGQTATRFTKEHHVKRTPGPGTYNYSDLATELKKNALISRTRKGGFGSTAVRELPLRKKNEEYLPGPAQYVVKSHRVGENKKRQAVFKSTTNRLVKTPGNVVDAPPPGSYEVANSFDKTQGKTLALLEKRETKGKKINGGFLSSTKRFSQPRDIIVKKTDIQNPGPGNYDVKKPDIPGGYLVTREERFKPLKSDIPGPGTYQLSPLLHHSVLKSTFNATLNNPVQYVLEDVVETNPTMTPFTVTG